MASWSRPVILEAYKRIVAQARRPEFYLAYKVSDTVEGRFELILLHLLLVLRTARAYPGGRDFSQDLFDLFIRDMDRSMREMGVGDITIPKKMKQVGRAFYGRAQRYDEALSAGALDAFSRVLARNIFDQDEPSACSRRMALYGLTAEEELKALEPDQLLSGRLVFPDPSVIAHA